MNNASFSGNITMEVYPCDLPPFFPPSFDIPASINYIQACIALLLGLIGFLLNLFILVMVVSYKILHQRLMYLALQIVCIDLVYTLTIPPVIFASGVSGEWLLGEAMCNILGIVHDFFAMFRFTTTLVLTLDRFISVFWPFFYSRRSLYFVLGISSAMYVVSILRALLPVTGILSCYVYIPTQKTCTAFSGCSTGCFWFIVGSTATVIIFGALIPLLLYIVLFCKIRTIKKQFANLLPYLGEGGGGDVSTVSSAGKTDTKTSITSLGSFGFRVGSKSSPSIPVIEVECGSKTGPILAGNGSKSSSVPVADAYSVLAESGSKLSLTPAIDVKLGSKLDSDPSTVANDDVDFVPNMTNGDASPAILEPHCDQNGSTASEANIVRCSVNIGDVSETSNGDIGPPGEAVKSVSTPTAEGADADTSTEPALPVSNGAVSLTNRDTEPLNDDTEPPNDDQGEHLGFESGFGVGSRHKSLTDDKDQRIRKSRMDKSNIRTNVTMFILLMSVIGCTAPAFVLYGIQFLIAEPEPVLFIVNMLIGRTSFNLLPVVDSIAIMRHREFRMAANRLLRSIRQKLHW